MKYDGYHREMMFKVICMQNKLLRNMKKNMSKNRKCRKMHLNKIIYTTLRVFFYADFEFDIEQNIALEFNVFLSKYFLHFSILGLKWEWVEEEVFRLRTL